jgi:DNA-3-methyladenine glycosylase I
LNDPLYVRYHDEEWGVPLHGNDAALFERICLEGAQAGLSWITILRKRENFRRAFGGFDPEAIARYRPAKIEKLLADPGIVRNRQKVEGAVASARAYLALRAEGSTFDEHLWSFVGGSPLVHRYRSIRDIPARTRESEAMSRDLVRRGFRFVGPTICYAFMQAVGMVNDHTVGCFRHEELT